MQLIWNGFCLELFASRFETAPPNKCPYGTIRTAFYSSAERGLIYCFRGISGVIAVYLSKSHPRADRLWREVRLRIYPGSQLGSGGQMCAGSCLRELLVFSGPLARSTP